MTAKYTLAIIVPVMNETNNIRPLTERVASVMATEGVKNWEITFVDDGSTDTTLEKILALHLEGFPVGYLSLSRNFGHQRALEAGLTHADADVVITMDGDLQHPPEEMTAMLAAWREGAEIVHMVPEKAIRQETEPFYRFYKLISDNGYVSVGSDFRLMSRRVVNLINQIPEQRKVIRALSTSLGFEQRILHYQQPHRLHGSSTYGMVQRINMAINLVFNYTTFPLKLVFYAGLIIAPISFCFGVGHIITKLIFGNQVTPGFTDIIVWLLFLSGSILLAIGIIGKYLENILVQVVRRPSYVVKDVLVAKQKKERRNELQDQD